LFHRRDALCWHFEQWFRPRFGTLFMGRVGVGINRGLQRTIRHVVYDQIGRWQRTMRMIGRRGTTLCFASVRRRRFARWTWQMARADWTASRSGARRGTRAWCQRVGFASGRGSGGLVGFRFLSVDGQIEHSLQQGIEFFQLLSRRADVARPFVRRCEVSDAFSRVRSGRACGRC